MMFYWQKTRPETHLMAFDENLKTFEGKNCCHEKN